MPYHTTYHTVPHSTICIVVYNLYIPYIFRTIFTMYFPISSHLPIYFSHLCPHFSHLFVADFPPISEHLGVRAARCLPQKVRQLHLRSDASCVGEAYENDRWGRKNDQWPFQEPKLEVPTIYKAYVRAMQGDIPPKYGLIWYSTSILGSWNTH